MDLPGSSTAATHAASPTSCGDESSQPRERRTRPHLPGRRSSMPIRGPPHQNPLLATGEPFEPQRLPISVAEQSESSDNVPYAPRPVAWRLIRHAHSLTVRRLLAGWPRLQWRRRRAWTLQNSLNACSVTALRSTTGDLAPGSPARRLPRTPSYHGVAVAVHRTGHTYSNSVMRSAAPRAHGHRSFTADHQAVSSAATAASKSVDNSHPPATERLTRYTNSSTSALSPRSRIGAAGPMAKPQRFA